MKYLQGESFILNKNLEFPEGYSDLEKGSLFWIDLIGNENIEYPYLIKFQNDFVISLNENEIDDLIKEKIIIIK